MAELDLSCCAEHCCLKNLRHRRSHYKKHVFPQVFGFFGSRSCKNLVFPQVSQVFQVLRATTAGKAKPQCLSENLKNLGNLRKHKLFETSRAEKAKHLRKHKLLEVLRRESMYFLRFSALSDLEVSKT